MPLLSLIILTLSLSVQASTQYDFKDLNLSSSEFKKYWNAPNWSDSARLGPGSNRANIFKLTPELWAKAVHNGKIHALRYPVEVTGLLIPYRSLKFFLEADHKNPLRRLAQKIGKASFGWRSMNDLYDFLGLNKFAPSPEESFGNIPFPRGDQHYPELPMGATFIKRHGEVGLTFGCAECHTGTLFGKPVFGLTNRFPRANRFFEIGRKAAPKVPNTLFKLGTDANKNEIKMFADTKRNISRVGAKNPVVLGLDTSLAQVAISLAKRKEDAWATPSKLAQQFPRKQPLKKKVADSKPAVWWNLKYKTHWLSDGSIRSGNPIFTNFLWNEIGRGVDLRELNKWLKSNEQKVMELTAAVFAAEAPHYTDFFEANKINLEKAKKGEKHFKMACAKCHGQYHKNWSLPEANELSNKEVLKTAKVVYSAKTKTIDVGTDPGRHQGMKYFSKDLNRLQISKNMGTLVTPQKGYVPPPLVGIWARWPYFHNNSAPNLCAVLTASKKRPKSWWMGEPIDRDRHFDQECNGYPVGDKTPNSWKFDKEYFYNTKHEGMSNKGHDRRIFIKNGKEIFSRTQKLELIEFLKTL